MVSEEHLSAVVFYYDTQVSPENQPERVARRCGAEIILLCEQLFIISEQMTNSLRKKETEDIISLCHFHHENLLLRLYALRERVWDVMAALADVPRKATGNNQFRSSVLSRIKTNYPNIETAFSSLLSLIEPDMEWRNVATHETILILGLMGDNSANVWELELLLDSFDPQSEDGL